MANSMPRSRGCATCHPGRNSTGGGNGPQKKRVAISETSGWVFEGFFNLGWLNDQDSTLEDHPSGSK